MFEIFTELDEKLTFVSPKLFYSYFVIANTSSCTGTKIKLKRVLEKHSIEIEYSSIYHSSIHFSKIRSNPGRGNSK